MKDFFQGEFLDNIKRIFNDIAGKLSYVDNPGKNVLIKAFSVLIALIAAVSLIFVVLEVTDDSDVDQTSSSNPQESTTESTTAFSSFTKELKSNILFCLDDDKNNIHMLFLLQLNSYQNTATAIFLEPDSICEANNVTLSLNQHLQKGGITQLIMAVEKYTSFDVDRYVIGDEKALTSFIREVGDVEINVRDSISYDHDGLSYIIDDGKQIMTPDILLKYVIYLSDNRIENTQSVCELISSFAQVLFDCEDSQAAQDNFDDIVGYFDTDISAMDFSENKAAVMKLAHEFALKLKPINNLSELASEEAE